MVISLNSYAGSASGMLGDTGFRMASRKYYNNHTPGDEVDDYVEPKDRVIQTWGIQGEDGKDIMMGWKVSGVRKVGDHGYKGVPQPSSKYGKALYDDMFRGWH